MDLPLRSLLLLITFITLTTPPTTDSFPQGCCRSCCPTCCNQQEATTEITMARATVYPPGEDCDDYDLAAEATHNQDGSSASDDLMRSPMKGSGGRKGGGGKGGGGKGGGGKGGKGGKGGRGKGGGGKGSGGKGSGGKGSGGNGRSSEKAEPPSSGSPGTMQRVQTGMEALAATANLGTAITNFVKTTEDSDEDDNDGEAKEGEANDGPKPEDAQTEE